MSFTPAPPAEALFTRPREEGVPLAWKSALIPPYDDFLNLDSFIILDLLGGAVEAVEILHLEKNGARSVPANDMGRTHKMFIDLSNRPDVERKVTISPKREGAELLFTIDRAPASDRWILLGDGLAALVAGNALIGLRVLGYYD